MQMENICTDWNIPFLNLSSITRPADIPEILKQSSPKIILSSVEDISKAEVQSELQLVDITYVAIDESQVLRQNGVGVWFGCWCISTSLLVTMTSNCLNSDIFNYIS